MHPGKLHALMALLDRCQLSELLISGGGETIQLSRQGAVQQASNDSAWMPPRSIGRSPFALLEIRQWAEWARANNLKSFSTQRRNCTLQFRIGPVQRRRKPIYAAELAASAIVAPVSGEFLSGHPAGQGHTIGQDIDQYIGQDSWACPSGIVGFIRTGLILQPVYPSAPGTIGEPLVRAGDPVAAGEPLFVFDPD